MPCETSAAGNDTFAVRLRAAMVKRGMTQRALAAAVGLSESAVSQYLSGAREPNLRVLAGLCSALGTSPSEFVPVALPEHDPATLDDGATLEATRDAASIVATNAALLSADERKSLVLALFDAQVPAGLA